MIKHPRIGQNYFTRSGLKTYQGKDRKKGHVFAPIGKGERTIYYTQEEIEQGVVCNPLEIGAVINSKWGKVQYQGYDKSKAKYIFTDASGNVCPCTINDFIVGNVGSKAKKEPPKYEDFGRKAVGARKDLKSDWNIQGLSEQQREKLLVKTKILDKPDIEKMYADNHDYLLCGLLNMLWSALPSKAEVVSIELQEQYIKLLREVWNYGLSWKSYDTVKRADFEKFLIDKGFIEGIYYGGILPVKTTPRVWVAKLYDVYRHMESSYRLQGLLNKKNFLKSAEEKKLIDYAINKNPDIEYRIGRPHICVRTQKWIAKIPVKEEDIPENREELWTVALVNKQNLEVLTMTAKSEEEGQKIAIENYNKRHKIGTGNGRTKTPLVYALEEMKRVPGDKGVKRRKDVLGKDFLKTFGLSGEFGNWVSDSERLENMNSAFDAFNDLAIALGIDQKDISLGNSLIIAFGSRGKGNAMAHYEADTNVINLTKMKGAGCVSHEWCHAFDYNVGQRAGCHISFTHAYETNPYTVPKPVREYIDALKMDTFGRKTQFLKDAEKIDKMHSKRDSYGYWASTVELFARAGDSFVKDELKSLGMRNDYLCGKSQHTVGSDGTAINPRGEEAKVINEKFKAMMKYCKEQGWLL